MFCGLCTLLGSNSLVAIVLDLLILVGQFPFEAVDQLLGNSKKFSVGSLLFGQVVGTQAPTGSTHGSEIQDISAKARCRRA